MIFNQNDEWWILVLLTLCTMIYCVINIISKDFLLAWNKFSEGQLPLRNRLCK